jgi:hypothetical protein
MPLRSGNRKSRGGWCFGAVAAGSPQSTISGAADPFLVAGPPTH